MVTRYPQPPGDEGSRKKLANRKASVSDVAKGYMGIVNIYQLIPKGAGPVPVTSLGIPPAPAGSKIYPQKKQKPTPEQLAAERRLSLAHTDVGWKFDTSERQFRLAVKEGDRFGQFLLPARDYSPDSMTKYENELNLHPNLVERNIDRKKYNHAMDRLLDVEGTEKFPKVLFQQAMNLRIHIGRMKELFDDYKSELKARGKETEITTIGEVPRSEKKSVGIEFPSLMQSKEIASRVLPNSLPGIRRIAPVAAHDPSRGFQKISDATAVDIFKRKPEAVKYVEEKEGVTYYLDPSVSVDRRKQRSKTKIKRKVSSKSKLRKTAILKKLKCKCKKPKRRR